MSVLDVQTMRRVCDRGAWLVSFWEGGADKQSPFWVFPSPHPVPSSKVSDLGVLGAASGGGGGADLYTYLRTCVAHTRAAPLWWLVQWEEVTD